MVSLSDIFIFITISTMMISISMIFRNAENSNFNKIIQKKSIIILMFSITAGLFIIMLAKF